MKTVFDKIPDSLRRILVVFVVFLGGVLLVRTLLPASLKDKNIHIASTIERETSKPVHYAGSEVCADCHTEYATKKEGYHKNLSCETCHGPAKEHSENPTETKPSLPKMRSFCEGCHTYNQSRPTGFPMINPVAHNPMKQCVACHNPHDPKPPQTPQECEGCHGEIARTKALSPHALLECTTCHTTPQDHKLKPRIVKASIPTERSFCGKCHGKDSTNKETPKVDVASHGEKYPCWQCHYPHMPEVQ